MPEVFANVLAWFSTPLGQVALSVGAYLIAKRFPAFQSLLWYVLDAFKVPRPNAPDVPGPVPSPTPTPGPSPSPAPAVDLGGMVGQLLAALLASRQHAAASELIALAQRIDADRDAGPKAKGDA